MNRNKGYDEEDVKNRLRKKHDIKILKDRKNILLLFGSQAKGDIGIGSSGKIDFLVNYCGYRVEWTDDFY